jgi:type II secretory pathway pseudopilin PulG
MKLRALTNLPRTRREAAFTMVEIAIALGIIAFALIAIIGVLPAGLQANRDNREDTIVNQDARVLIEAIKTGGRDVTSDIGAFVDSVDGTNYAKPNPPLSTPDFIRLLSDTDTNRNGHEFVIRAMSGAVANRESDLGFRYQVHAKITNAVEFANSPRMREQVYEVRLRFAWPVQADGSVNSEANRYVVRTLVSGWHTNGVFYAQRHFQP